jgi:acetate kinase
MTDSILALNAGSSSVKFALFALSPGDDDLVPVYAGQIAGLFSHPRFSVKDTQGRQIVATTPALSKAGQQHKEALATLLAWLDQHDDGLNLHAVGHRIVHGGEHFTHPVRLNATILQQLERLNPLAPLHQPHTLAAVRAIGEINPALPQVACFDTAFHHTQSPVAQAFALPRAITEQGVRRYGFHGLSYEYIASVLPTFAGDAADGRVIVAHLGNGASMCALHQRQSVAHSMGFTALDGLVMGTRCGTLDAGVVLHLLNEHGMETDTVTDILYHQSGLFGVSGISHDMKTLLASDTPQAAEAIDVFVYRIRRELGALAAILGGLDVLVLTGGIGEHAAPVRARICHDAAWLGVRLDETANANHGPCISTADSAVSVWVIPTNEDRMIAQHTRHLVASGE